MTYATKPNEHKAKRQLQTAKLEQHKPQSTQSQKTTPNSKT